MKRGKMKAVVVWILVLLMMATYMGVTALASEEIQATTEDPVTNAEVKPEKEVHEEELPEPEEKPAATENEPESSPEPTVAASEAYEAEANPQVELTPEPAIEDSPEPDSKPESEAEPGTQKPEEEEPSEDRPESEEIPSLYIVKFMNADDTEFMAVKVNEGELIPKPKTDPSLNGFEFQYWYNVKEGEKTPFKFTSGDIATEDLILKAFFILKGEELPEGEDINEAQEPEDEAFVEETPKPSIDRSVSICSNIGATVSYGDIIVLAGELNGYEDVDCTMRWEVNDGNGWAELRGEDGLSYSFILDENNIANQYRIAVTVDEEV